MSFAFDRRTTDIVMDVIGTSFHSVYAVRFLCRRTIDIQLSIQGSQLYRARNSSGKNATTIIFLLRNLNTIIPSDP
jgi:hypothetical protein